ncbi:unnamed protein product [Angiostrongylus costaricensis]|uniref:DUF5872 domain-containing protein n=1 Tax=Angiostrongylus costaricensis TaxID=334426 RepID=A0A0R3Q2A1_ANGCS|nr:unnamed protein product [Angiostrongylus costaricensis]
MLAPRTRMVWGERVSLRKVEKAAKSKKNKFLKQPSTRISSLLVGCWEDAVIDNIDEGYDRVTQHLHISAMKAESAKVTKRRLSPEALERIRQYGIA